MADTSAGSAVMILGFEAVNGAVEVTDRSPDIVLVVADDLSWGYVGFEGRTKQGSADFDQHAAGKAVFVRPYAASRFVDALPNRHKSFQGIV